MKPWIYLLGAVALAASVGGAYAAGRGDGSAIERDKQASIERATAKVREERDALLDQLGAVAAAREDQRQGNMRELRYETHKIIEKPVYRNVCVDADGVRLLDRAAAIANGEDPGGVPDRAGEAAAAAPNG